MWRLMAVVAALAFVLAACGDDDEAAAPADLGGELGCDSFEERETEELYVRELFECVRDGEASNVYTFNDAEARDSWRDVAEGFGIVVLDEGDDWLEVEPL